jgi:hypothetical protein
MRRDGLFWGGILILLGLLFFLQASGVITDVFGWFWPIGLMLLGLLILAGVLWPGSARLGEAKALVSLDENAKSAHIDMDFGASSLFVRGGAEPGMLIYGSSATALSVNSKMAGDVQEVNIDAGPSFLPFLGSASGSWDFQFSSEIPLSLDVDAGASTMTFDLADLQVREISVDGGASTINVTVPKACNCLVKMEVGAATINITVPQGVEARLHMDGLMSLNIDEKRFSQVGSFRQTAGFDTAQTRVEIELDGGASSVNIN